MGLGDGSAGKGLIPRSAHTQEKMSTVACTCSLRDCGGSRVETGSLGLAGS